MKRIIPTSAARMLFGAALVIGLASVFATALPALAEESGHSGGTGGSSSHAGGTSHASGESHDEDSGHSGGKKGGSDKGHRGSTVDRGRGSSKGGVTGHVFDQPEG